MFERTFSFWRRLMGGDPKPPPSQDDRRLWARYQSDIPANALPAGSGDSARIPVKVRDISRGGASLLTDQVFEEGQMLSLELPGEEDDVNDVLACVVRVVPESAGYALGCVFSQELSDQDLEGFGAKKVRPPPEDQRIWMRFACNITARCRKVGVEAEELPAQVIDLSPTGVGLKVGQPVEAGTLLNVELLAQDGHLVRSILACVVHVNGHTGADWALGCNFIRELEEADMQALI